MPGQLPVLGSREGSALEGVGDDLVGTHRPAGGDGFLEPVDSLPPRGAILWQERGVAGRLENIETTPQATRPFRIASPCGDRREQGDATADADAVTDFERAA